MQVRKNEDQSDISSTRNAWLLGSRGSGGRWRDQLRPALCPFSTPGHRWKILGPDFKREEGRGDPKVFGKEQSPICPFPRKTTFHKAKNFGEIQRRFCDP